MATFLLFLSSFGGVFIAFMLGLWGQSAQRRHVNDVQRYETIQSILAELGAVQLAVSDAHRLRTEEPDIFQTSTFFGHALQTAVSSGRFALLDIGHQTAISREYSWLQKLDDLLFLTHQRPESWYSEWKEEVDWIRSEIDSLLEELQESIPELIVLLSVAPKPSKSTYSVMLADLS